MISLHNTLRMTRVTKDSTARGYVVPQHHVLAMNDLHSSVLPLFPLFLWDPKPRCSGTCSLMKEGGQCPRASDFLPQVHCPIYYHGPARETLSVGWSTGFLH